MTQTNEARELLAECRGYVAGDKKHAPTDERGRLCRRIDAYLAKPAPDILAAVEAAVPELTADEVNQQWGFVGATAESGRVLHNAARAAVLDALRTALGEQATPKCTLAEALAMAVPGDVLRGSDGIGPRCAMSQAINGCFGGGRTPWRLDIQSDPATDEYLAEIGVTWHTFVHNGAVYSIREQADAGAEPLAVDCANCQGKGRYETMRGVRAVCRGCNGTGTGTLPAPEQGARGEYCPDCHGAGEDACNDRDCARCAGGGVVDAEQPAEDAPAQDAGIADGVRWNLVQDLAEQVTELAEAVRTLQAQVNGDPQAPDGDPAQLPARVLIAALASKVNGEQGQQGGELREGEPCLIWLSDARPACWDATAYHGEWDIRNGGEFHYLPQPAPPVEVTK